MSIMNKNIIDTYSTIIELKNVIRTGWKEVGVSPNKIESIMDHIGGSVFLAMIISTEKNYTLDMTKVYEMIAINEIKKLEKANYLNRNLEKIELLRKEIERLENEIMKDLEW